MTTTTEPASSLTQTPVSHADRFEVLHRDGFACHFCGRRPPDVTLTVERIRPILDGGSNSTLNMVTACVECGMGRRNIMARALRTDPRQDALAENWGVGRLALWASDLAQHNDLVCDRMAEELATRSGVEIEEPVRRELGVLIRHYGADVVTLVFEERGLNFFAEGDLSAEERIDRAARFVNHLRSWVAERVRSEERPHEKKLLYIRGVLRSRLVYVRESEVLDTMREASAAGVPVDLIEKAARSCRSWGDFWAALSELMRSASS